MPIVRTFRGRTIEHGLGYSTVNVSGSEDEVLVLLAACLRSFGSELIAIRSQPANLDTLAIIPPDPDNAANGVFHTQSALFAAPILAGGISGQVEVMVMIWDDVLEDFRLDTNAAIFVEAYTLASVDLADIVDASGSLAGYVGPDIGSPTPYTRPTPTTTAAAADSLGLAIACWHEITSAGVISPSSPDQGWSELYRQRWIAPNSEAIVVLTAERSGGPGNAAGSIWTPTWPSGNENTGASAVGFFTFDEATTPEPPPPEPDAVGRGVGYHWLQPRGSARPGGPYQP